MIYEYALEPELVATWHSRDDFRFFLDKFGLGCARMVSRFPKSWVKLVWQSFAPDSGDMARKRLEVLLMRFTERMIRRPGARYDGTVAWLVNVETENTRLPFHTIIARQNPRAVAAILVPSALDQTDALWAVKIDDVVPRTARDLAAAVESMLRSCSKVVFIDPNFGPENARHRRPLREFLRVLGARPLEEFPEVEIHTKEKSTAEFFKEACETELTGLIPAGLSVRFKRWRIRAGSKALHHRYILTDLGGVGFRYGLDDGSSGESDDVNLLSAKTYATRWNQYLGDRPAFEPVDEITIVGRD